MSKIYLTQYDGSLVETNHTKGSTDEWEGRLGGQKYCEGATYYRVMIDGKKHFFANPVAYAQFTRRRDDPDHSDTSSESIASSVDDDICCLQ
jgi:hypothetical protein